MVTPTQIVTLLTITLTREHMDLLEDIFQASKSDDAFTVAWLHQTAARERLFCELGSMGLIECSGSLYDWNRAWAHPSNLAHELFCLEEPHGNRWAIEPRDAWECRLVEWEQLPLFVDNNEQRW